MGLGRSRQRRNMDADNEDSNLASSSSGGGEGTEADLGRILSYLLRSGQVRILRSGRTIGRFSDDDEDDDINFDEEEDDIDYEVRADTPEENPNPDVSALETNSLRQEIEQRTFSDSKKSFESLPGMVFKREVGSCRKRGGFAQNHCRKINSWFIPNSVEKVAWYRSKAFCGTYSSDGKIFLSACQDQHIRVYDTYNGAFKLMKSIRAKDVGWSVLDTAFSPDGNYLIYSSWSDCVHICNIWGEHDTHNALHMCPEGEHSFCVFSLMFSSDNKEILGGANDGCIYIFDREKNERTLRIESHEDDVNSVAFADDSSHILFSGGDDGLIRVWDRRTLEENSPLPVGTLAGHMDGITFIDSRGDGRYLISNSKDQTIKLWDIRKFSNQQTQDATRREVARQSWDYRWQQVPRKIRSRRTKRIAGDTSLMTYSGHSVLHTLIRCRFSPVETTGQRYIYSGCATGNIIIYDLLSGKIEKKLTDAHRSCVRDVSWHPYENNIISTSWDCSLGYWTYYNEDDEDDYCDDAWDEATTDDDDQPCLRRSKRIKKVHQRSSWSRRSHLIS